MVDDIILIGLRKKAIERRQRELDKITEEERNRKIEYLENHQEKYHHLKSNIWGKVGFKDGLLTGFFGSIFAYSGLYCSSLIPRESNDTALSIITISGTLVGGLLGNIGGIAAYSLKRFITKDETITRDKITDILGYYNWHID